MISCNQSGRPGTSAAGGVFVPINPVLKRAQVAHILADSGAKALIVPDRWKTIDYLDRLARLPHLPALQHGFGNGEDQANNHGIHACPIGKASANAENFLVGFIKC